MTTPPPAAPATSAVDRGWRTTVAWGCVVAHVVVVALGLWLGARAAALQAPAGMGFLGWNGLNLLLMGVFTTFTLAGGTIVGRRPRNRVGWAMLLAGLTATTAITMDIASLLLIGTAAGEPPVLGVAARILANVGSRLGVVVALIALTLLYPDGELPSSRWRVPAGLLVLFSGLWTASTVLAPRLTGAAYPFGREPIEVFDVANPLDVEAFRPVVEVLSGPLEAFFVLGAISIAVAMVVVRFRSSSGIRRQQMKWFTYAASLHLGLLAASVVLGRIGVPEVLLQAAQGAAYLSLTAFPAAVVMAVLRYRLYEIDRIISRTVTYALLVAILAGIYAVTVIGLGAAVTAVTGVEDSDLVVGGATLLAVALFRPIRTRVRTMVDRRFNRTDYEAAQAVDVFAREVRDEVGIERIRRRTLVTAASVVEPTNASLWLLDEEEDEEPPPDER